MAGRGDHQVPLLPHQPGAREEQAGEHRARLLPRGQQANHSVSCNLRIENYFQGLDFSSHYRSLGPPCVFNTGNLFDF